MVDVRTILKEQRRSQKFFNKNTSDEEVHIANCLFALSCHEIDEKHLRVIFEQQDIVEFFDYAVSNYRSMPYLGVLQKVIVVTACCYEGAIQEKLSKHDVKLLLIASIFQDCDRLYTIEDIDNVIRAIKYFVTFNSKASKPLVKPDQDKVCFYIRHTRHPYLNKGKISNDYENKPAKVIRDSELLYVYAADNKNGNNILCSYASSSNKPIELLQRDLINVNWQTTWGRKRSIVSNFNKQRDIYLELCRSEIS